MISGPLPPPLYPVLINFRYPPPRQPHYHYPHALSNYTSVPRYLFCGVYLCSFFWDSLYPFLSHCRSLNTLLPLLPLLFLADFYSTFFYVLLGFE